MNLRSFYSQHIYSFKNIKFRFGNIHNTVLNNRIFCTNNLLRDATTKEFQFSSIVLNFNLQVPLANFRFSL
jgi:hypothetical protein